MIRHHFVTALAALSVCTLPATTAKACCGLKSWFGSPAPTTTFYAPYTASFAPAGCGQTVNYMPQTCFRTVFVNTPVTTFRPVPACGPCGQPTTVMRPVTTFVMRPQLVPYTTFRPVAVAPVTQAAFFAPAPVAVAPSPVAMPAAPAAPCCGGGAPAVMSAPATPMLAPAPMPATGVPAGMPGASVPSLAPGYPGAPTANVAPSLAAPPAAAPAAPQGSNQTFGSGGSTETNRPAETTPPANSTPSNSTPYNGAPADPSKPQPQSRLLLPAAPPAQQNSTDRGALRGLDPEDQDRLTAVPMRQAFAVRPASAISRLPAVAKPANAADSEWRAARP